jgi:putative adhesin
VIRAVLVAALFFAPAAVHARPHPVKVEVPEIELPDIDVDLHALLAKGGPRYSDPEDPEFDIEVDDDDSGDDRVETDGKAKVYKLNPQRVRVPRIHVGEDDHDFDEREATARAKGSGAATLEVKGPVTFQLRAQAGEVEVVATDKRQVSVSLTEAPAEEIVLYAFGDRVEPSFRGRRTLRRGKLHVELPRGSRLDLSSMSGDVTAQRIGDVRVRTMSGDVKLSGVAKVDVQTISGDTRIEDAAGPVRLHTVSGNVVLTTSGPAPQVEFQSASGGLDWTGVCGKDCHLSAETVSGDLRLRVDPKSSFELSYTSHSGELRDELNLAVKRSPRRKHGMSSGWLEASYGKGEGVIEADAFSGSLLVRKK